MPQQLFVFLQFEYPWALGPADGRYLIRAERDGEAERVLVVATLAADAERPPAPASGRLLGRLLGDGTRPTTAAPAPAPTTRVTLIDPVPLAAENQARAWLSELDSERQIEAAMAVLNGVIQDQRIAAADPYTREVSSAQALIVRAGWGEGEQVADGRWLHARELVRPDRRRAGRRPGPGSRGRVNALRPQERLAALLGARHRALLCEELVLRARADVDQTRLAHAALTLQSAYRAALAELGAEGRQDLSLRLAELAQLETGLADQAELALSRDSALDGDLIEHALGRLEATLRARTAAGLG